MIDLIIILAFLGLVGLVIWKAFWILGMILKGIGGFIGLLFKRR